MEVKELAYIENKISRLNVFRVRAGLFGLCFHRYTWLFNAEKKTKSSSKNTKEEEAQKSKMQPLHFDDQYHLRDLRTCYLIIPI